MSTMYAAKGGVSMKDDARESLLLAVFNDLPDADKDAVLALGEKIRSKKPVLTRISQTEVGQDGKQSFGEAIV